MALARAEAAVQVGRLAGVVDQGAVDEAQRVVEAPGQLVGDHVLRDRLLRVFDALGQLEHEVAAVDGGRGSGSGL